MNSAISMLVAKYEERAELLLTKMLPTCETLLYTGGGDRGIYAAGRAIVNSVDQCSQLILLRIDPHMDERSVYCRSDPSIRKLTQLVFVHNTSINNFK